VNGRENKTSPAEAGRGHLGNANAAWITERSEGYERGGARDEAPTKLRSGTECPEVILVGQHLKVEPIFRLSYQ
jgi:hypothetical protein